MKVLIVEDNDLNSMLCAMVLKRNGQETKIAKSGQEALQSLRNHRHCSGPQRHFDLVLLDLQMPEMDGFEVSRRIRAMTAVEDPNWCGAIPIILMTACSLDNIDAQVKAFGLNGYISKPVDVKSFYQTIADAVQKSRHFTYAPSAIPH